MCGPGSTSPRAVACGGARFYCPEGSSTVRVVAVGNYTVGGDGPTTRSAQARCPDPSEASSNGSSWYCEGDGLMRQCPGGVYGDVGGLSSSACSGVCSAGYFCPAGSVSGTAVACGGMDRCDGVTWSHQCAASACPRAAVDHVTPHLHSCLCSWCHCTRYCPAGSSVAVLVPLGSYSLPEGGPARYRTGVRVCEPGQYCSGDGVRRPCVGGRYSTAFNRSTECDTDCPAGRHCRLCLSLACSVSA